MVLKRIKSRFSVMELFFLIFGRINLVDAFAQVATVALFEWYNAERIVILANLLPKQWHLNVDWCNRSPFPIVVRKP